MAVRNGTRNGCAWQLGIEPEVGVHGNLRLKPDNGYVWQFENADDRDTCIRRQKPDREYL